jgi:SSS family solute:Na+ symporter
LLIADLLPICRGSATNQQCSNKSKITNHQSKNQSQITNRQSKNALTPHLILLLTYSAFLIGLGLWVGRRVRAGHEFFVAGRRLPAILIFATVLAANIGAGSTLGAASIAYEHGLSAWWWNGSAGIGSLLLAFWIGPRIWREASKHGFFTIGDFLQHHYDGSVRTVVSTLLWIGTLAILAAQFIGGALIFEAVAGIPRTVGYALGGLVVVSYFTAGGLLGSAWVNLVQLAVLLTGFAAVLPLALASAGGWSSIVAASAGRPGYTDLWRAVGVESGWTLLPMLVPAFMISPGLLQKAYGARSDAAIRIGIGANGIALMIFAFVPALIGMAARVRHPDLPTAALALPTLLVEDVSPAVGGLVLAAVFSAEVSTCDVILFMLATSLSQDLYRGVLRPRATDADVLRVARLAAIAGGALGVGLAVVLETIVDALRIFYTLLGVSLFVPVVAALHLRRVRPIDAHAAIAGGIVTTLVLQWTTGGKGFGVLSPGNAGIIAAALAFGASYVSTSRR